jgi:ribosome-binding factor A
MAMRTLLPFANVTVGRYPELEFHNDSDFLKVSEILYFT